MILILLNHIIIRLIIMMWTILWVLKSLKIEFLSNINTICFIIKLNDKICNKVVPVKKNNDIVNNLKFNNNFISFYSIVYFIII